MLGICINNLTFDLIPTLFGWNLVAKKQTEVYTVKSCKHQEK